MIVVRVVLEGAGTLSADAEPIRSDWEVFEDVEVIEEGVGTEEELATGELVEESEGPGLLVVDVLDVGADGDV